MGLLFLPRREFDSSGNVLNGGKLKFFDAGTTTPKNVYPTEADAQADTNGQTSFTADSGGLFAAIYGDDAADYKVRLTDSSDTQIWEEDDVSALALTTGETVTRVTQGFNSPLDFGAVGDGVADEQTEVQQAIDQAETDGTYVVDLLGFTFRCDTPLTLHSGVKLKNGKLDFSNDTSAEHIIIQGTVGSPVALSANADAGDSALSTADTSTISVGQWVHVGDLSDWDTGSNIDQGLLMKVRQITTNSSFRCNGRFPLTLTTANTAQFTPLTMLEDIVLEDLEIVSGTDNSTITLLIDTADRVRVRNVKFDGIPARGIETRLAANVVIEGCEFGPSNATSSTCVAIWECSTNVVVKDCTMYECEQSVDMGSVPAGGLKGITRHVTVKDCRSLGATAQHIYAREGTHQISILNNYIEGYDGSNGDEGIQCEGGNTRIEGNVLNWLHGVAIKYDSELTTTATLYQKNSVRIAGNEIHECSNTTAAIEVGSDQVIHADIEGNWIYGGAGVGIYTNSLVAGELSITNNRIQDAAKSCISLNPAGSVVTLNINGNILREETGGTDIIFCDIAVVIGAVISGNNIQKQDDTNDCININPTETTGDFTVSGNILNNGDYGIRIGTAGEAVQYGNIFTGQGTADTVGTFDTFVSS